MKNNKLLYYVINKPYGVLSQFTDEDGRKTLADILYDFPNDVYPVGRLDMDSEGLLLLTNDKELNHLLLNPKFRHEREYYAQVEGIPDAAAINKLENGIIIENRKTLPAKCRTLNPPPSFPERIPPIRERKNIPATWISLTLIEGRNRQVRKMTAAAGFPTLRLIRKRIANIQLNDLLPGKVRKLSGEEIINLQKDIKKAAL